VIWARNIRFQRVSWMLRRQRQERRGDSVSPFFSYLVSFIFFILGCTLVSIETWEIAIG